MDNNNRKSNSKAPELKCRDRLISITSLKYLTATKTV